MNAATFVSQINSPLSGPSLEPLDKETERCEPSASEIAHQRETLGRRRLESSSTEYENVQNFSLHLDESVTIPMDCWVDVHEHDSRRKAIQSIFSYEYMIRTHSTFNKNWSNCSMFDIIFIGKS